MTIADHPVVGEVGFAAWKSSDAFDPAYANAEVIERVRHDFAIFPQMTTGDVHLAVLEGAIVGWTARDNDRDYVSDVWVHPDCQGRGIGRTLVLHILDVIAAEGHPLARISTHASNSTAIRLYERCGFEIVWRGIEFSKSMNVDLEKVRMEKRLV
ncbi:GNAT family N-acetyltransferase [Rhizobiales bacterium RZME27]|jgi:ribosomal-protein-alanine N-acetyltransferase|uniref:GNAT family N-acetyltransferase n=1 Tax=Endobacterium cereale TaxID=2663029 RepID=A0A6A8AED0_9HYPH|nr:GNAT family N-acetyltransferase [Endobacterium cereale]MEB2846058.1 GNAT family N-acetyltransferase [Endobacterium cereale]MQY48268.1 GNAT family N-acetyltransferase [Endobacterium cereale]